ncbi:MAG: hypothetical protein WC028_24830 [Candidatus Obscuribacterales bacterium]
MWLLVAIIILILFNFTFKTSSQNARRQTVKDEQILRHTINVNLNILENEIIELTALIVADANQKTSTAAHEEAKTLLENAQAIASYARIHVSDKGYNELQEMLGQVYGAMNHATSARKLLNACRPL